MAQPLKLDLITLSVPLFFGGVLLEAAVNRWRKRGFYEVGDSLGSIGTGVLDQVAITVTRTALFTAPYVWLYRHARIWTFDEATPAVLIGGLCLADLGYYWAHRFSHKVAFLWAGHVVHHSSEQYNLSTALRQNWLSSWFLYMFNMPLAIVGIAPLVAVLIIPIIQLYQFWIHTRLIPKLGPFEWVFNSPSHHRVHHGINPEYVNRNYAAILIVWDRLFGTFAEERAPVLYGALKPLRSYNPVRAWTSPWVDLFRTGSLMAWLRPPGWDIANNLPPDVPAAFKVASAERYAPRLSRANAITATVVFVAILASASAFLFVYPGLDKPVAFGIAAAVIAALAIYGAWMDSKTKTARSS